MPVARLLFCDSLTRCTPGGAFLSADLPPAGDADEDAEIVGVDPVGAVPKCAEDVVGVFYPDNPANGGVAAVPAVLLDEPFLVVWLSKSVVCHRFVIGGFSETRLLKEAWFFYFYGARHGTIRSGPMRLPELSQLKLMSGGRHARRSLAYQRRSSI